MAKAKDVEKGDPLDLLRLIDQAGEEQLAAVNVAIARLDQEIDEFCAARRQRIASLKLLAKVIDTRLHGKAKKERTAATRPAKKRGEPSEIQTRVYDLIASEGAMPVPAIAARLNVDPRGIATSVRQCPWFERRNGEIAIAVTRG